MRAITIYGRAVSEQEIAAVMARMDKGPFRCADIVGVVEQELTRVRATNIPRGYAVRAADRLIQNARRAGRIVKGDKFGDWRPA